MRGHACGLLLALLTPVLLTGCGGAPSSSAASSPVPAKLRLGAALPQTGLNNLTGSLIAEPLIGIGWDGRPSDRVVSKWEWSADRLTLKLHLRPGLKFHDGSEVDIDNFEQTLKAAVKEASGNVSFGSIKGVSRDPESQDSLLVTLSRPEAFLVTDLANSSLRHPSNNQIGTGPFKLDAQTGKTINLTAFKDYYQGAPKLDQIEIENFGEQRGAWAALMRGELDALHEIAPTAIDFVQAEGQTLVRPYTFLRPYYLQLVFNTKHPALKNPTVRQALSYGVDRQAIVDYALNKQGRVAEGPIWPFHWAYSTAQKTYTHNTEAASLRLDAAGFKTKRGAPGRMPSRLRIKCLTRAQDAQFEKIALLLQKQLYEIGVDLEIESLPTPELTKRLEAGDFETLLIQRTSGRSLAYTYLSFHSSRSPGGYTAADKVLEHLRDTSGDAEIRAGVSDLQQILHDDPPAIFIAWPQVARVVSARIEVPVSRGSAPDEFGRDVLSSIWQWRPLGPGQ